MIMENGVGCFIMTYRQDLKKEEIVALISATLEEMRVKVRDHPAPIYLHRSARVASLENTHVVVPETSE